MMRTSEFSRVLSAVLMLTLLLMPVCSAAELDTSADAGITLVYTDGGSAIVGAEFDLYLVAALNADWSYAVQYGFSDYTAQIENEEADWPQLAYDLQTCVWEDELAAIASGTTDADGELVFAGLKPGVYLMLGQEFTVDTTNYCTAPSVITLPQPDYQTGKWAFDITAYPKPGTPFDSIEVYKNWEIGTSGVENPESITVQLLQYGEVISTALLTEENGWHLKFDNLQGGGWSVSEVELKNYKCTIVQRGNIFILTNTYTPSPDSNLPQTGQLWWPVPLLAAAGMVFLIIGMVRRRGM